MLNAKNRIPFLLVLVFALQARAEEAPKKYIDVYDPNYPKDAFQNVPGAKVLVHKEKKSQRLPSVEERDESFAKVKDLPTLVNGWDEMEKDLLFMRAKHDSLTKLKKQYPAIDAKLLVKLSKVVSTPKTDNDN